MVLLSRPVSSGAGQDAYDALEAVFGGGEFSEDEAANTLQTTLQMSSGNARNTVANLVSSGAIQ